MIETTQVYRTPGQSASRNFSARTDAGFRAIVYETLLHHLKGRTVNGHAALHPLARRAEREMLGKTEIEIDQMEISLLNHAEQFPQRWTVSQYVPRALYFELKRQGRENTVFEKEIVPIPTGVENALICERMIETFSRQTLLSIPGFVERVVEDEDFRVRVVRIDLDEWMARRGFLIPIRKGGSITSFRVFRRPSDARPFTLRSREVGLNA